VSYFTTVALFFGLFPGGSRRIFRLHRSYFPYNGDPLKSTPAYPE
jgi:hypothetical protein